MRLHRSLNDSMIGGVCGGLAEYFSFDVTFIRIAFVVATILGVGTPVLVYLVMWILMPEC